MNFDRTILVVDDDPEIRAVLSTTFEVEGFHVLTAVNGADALRQLERRRPAVILLDIVMPIMSGPEFRQAQLHRAEFATIPVVYMSAAHDMCTPAVHPGVQGYIRKPFDIDELVCMVSNLCPQSLGCASLETGVDFNRPRAGIHGEFEDR